MKVNLSKNKLLLINSLIIITSFIIFFAYLRKVNYDFEGWHSPLSVTREFLDSYFRPELYGKKDHLFYFSRAVLPLSLIIVDIIYIICLIISIIQGLNQKRNKEVKYSNLLFLSRIYLLSIIYFYMIDSTYFDGFRIDPNYSSKVLLPLILITTYNLITISIINEKSIKKELNKNQIKDCDINES